MQWLKINTGLVLGLVFGLSVVIIFLFSLPSELFDDPYSTVLEDQDGELLGARIAGDGQWRFPAMDSLPYKYEQSLLLYEDRFFYYHPGVNPFSIIRALYTNIKSGEIVSGGSTITMQVIRLSRKGKPRTVKEKIVEIWQSVRLEVSSKKKEIICLYGSHAPFGGNVVGLDAASWRYFGRSPYDLTWAESAMLAVLPNSPAMIHPGRNRNLLLSKRNSLLDRLHLNGKIDSTTCMLAKLEPLPDQPLPLPELAPHLVDFTNINYRGMRIRSTIRADLQRQLNRVCNEHHKRLSKNEIHNVAGLILDTKSGAILGYVGNSAGSSHDEHSGSVDIIRSNRSTGSILKPLLFCLMLDNGDILQESLVPDIPTQYTGYSPKNFSLEYDGAVPAKRALARSLNIPAVRMLQSYGLSKFYHQLKGMNMEGLSFPASHYGLSLILGGSESSLYWITGMYASMGRILLNYNETGKYFNEDIRNPHFVYGEKSDYSNASISAGAVYITLQSLIEVNRPETQIGWSLFESSRSIAWKTGTSFGFRDAWAVGTSPEYTVGIWAGNADGEGRPGLTGISAAAPVLFDVFGFMEVSSWFESPSEELFETAVCVQSGYLPGPHCADLDTLMVTQRGLRSDPCPYHITAHLSQGGRYRLNSSCAPLSAMRHESWFVLPPVQEWYFKQKHPNYKTLPQLHPDCIESESPDLMEMIYPRHSARVYVPREIDGSPGRIILEAAHRSPETLIYWHLDENFLGKTRHIHQMGIRPIKGKHTLILVDENGNSFSHDFEVVDK